MPLTIPVILLLAMLIWSTPSKAWAADETTPAFARFVSCSKPGVDESIDVDDVVIEIDASLPQTGKHGRFEGIRHRGPTGVPEYELMSCEGDPTVKHQVIARYLTAERQACAGPPESLALTPENYKFRYKASIELAPDRFLVFAIKPRHRTKGMIEGEIWIDAATGAVVHQEGRLTTGASLFLRRVVIVRDTGSRVDLPYFRVTRVDIETRSFGRAELTIRERPACRSRMIYPQP